jgi:hypothetical protein
LPPPDTVRDTRKLFESVENLSTPNVDKSTKIQATYVSQSYNNRHSHDEQKRMKKDENNVCRFPEFKGNQEKIISSRPAVPLKPSNLKHKTEIENVKMTTSNVSNYSAPRKIKGKILIVN